jgi:predicted small secreted protein
LIFPQGLGTKSIGHITRGIGMTCVYHRAAGAVAVLLVLTLGLSACGNTIRGVGKDLGGVVDATQDAGRSVASSVK